MRDQTISHAYFNPFLRILICDLLGTQQRLAQMQSPVFASLTTEFAVAPLAMPESAMGCVSSGVSATSFRSTDSNDSEHITPMRISGNPSSTDIDLARAAQRSGSPPLSARLPASARQLSENKDGSPSLQRTRWTVGRAPWYDMSGHRRRPLIIGVTGGSASGKTSVCQEIVGRLAIPWVVMISMDRFYKSLTPEQMKMAHEGNYNFDNPEAFDLDQMVTTISELRTGKVVHVPNYDFATHSRTPVTDKVYGCDVVIVEGILVLYDKRVRDLLDVKIYVETDSDLRLIRRITRDVKERGRKVEGVLEQYQKTVKPSFEEYILPTKRHADLIIPWNTTNHVAVDLLSQHIITKLEERSKEYFQESRKHQLKNPLPFFSSHGQTAPGGQLLKPSELPRNITVMTPSRSLRAIHTIIRDQTSDSEDFRFQVKRLVRLLVTEALNLLPYVDCTVTTPTGKPFSGVAQGSDIVAVSIVRTGEVFENALRNILPDVSIGKIVIHQAVSHKQEFGPRLYYAKLPAHIDPTSAESIALTQSRQEQLLSSTSQAVSASTAQSSLTPSSSLLSSSFGTFTPNTTCPRPKVLLFDGVLATGGAVNMAVQVLLDHGVLESDIIFCCLTAAPEGLVRLASIFPRLQIVTSWLEDGLDAQNFVKPGVGYLGDRYFGTGSDEQSNKT